MSDDQSARLGLPYLAAGQMQKHVTFNEALTRLDALIQTVVVSRTTAAQPATPDDGQLYILPEGASGAAWDAFAAGDLVRAEGGGWTVVDIPDGLLILIADEGVFVVRDGDGWSSLGARLSEVGPLGRLGVGTTADAANPFAARLNKALWTALEGWAGGDGDLRFTLNKESASDVLSLLFQSGWAGRAELGLIGNDDLTLKVGDDSGAWRTAMTVERETGRAFFPLGAARRETTIVTTDGTWSPPDWARSVEVVAVGGGAGGGAGAFGASGDRLGGGGGGAGGVSRAIWPAGHLTAGLTIDIGVGGAGGTTSSGSDGGDTVVRLGSTALLRATAGSAGQAGSDGGAAGGSLSNNGGASGASGSEPGAALEQPDASGGGGAGGALSAGGVARDGAAGGAGGALAVEASGGTGGVATAGGAGASAPLGDLHWAGGGGGGGSAVTSGAGLAGGAGGSAGAGGGGGGAGVTAGGAGGSGASGIVWLTAEG